MDWMGRIVILVEETVHQPDSSALPVIPSGSEQILSPSRGRFAKIAKVGVREIASR